MQFTAPNLPLEDVIREVIRSEPEPDFITLTKWCARYPRYREDLKEFFSKWSGSEMAANRLSNQTPGQPPSVIAKQLALRDMRNERRLPQADDVPQVEAFGRLVLTAIQQFQGRGRRKEIVARVAELAGLRVVPRSVLVSLRALAERELIWSWCDGRKTVRNRKGTVFFGITAAGGRALGTSDIPIPPGPVEEEPDDDEDLPANEDLQVILMEMHSEFEVPSYEALVRMCGRYPQYAKQLTDDFLSSAVSCIQNDEPQRLVELTQEERLSDALDFRSRREKEFLVEIMERQGRAMPPPPVTSLDAFDRHVLEAVYQLRGPRELAEINRKVARLTGIPVLPAAISVSVNRLESLGLIMFRPWFIAGDWFVKITTGGKYLLAKA